MRQLTISRIIRGFLVFAFSLAVFSQVVDAKSPVISLATTNDRGNIVSIAAGTKWKSKSVVLEVGVKTKNVWKWSRVGTVRTDASGAGIFCGSRAFTSGSQIRVKSSATVISTIKVSQAFTLSGCNYVAPVVTTPTVLSESATTSPAPATTAVPSVTTTTTSTTTTTAVPPTTTTTTSTTSSTTSTTTTTTTTIAPSTPAPTALALAASSDTGDSSTDGKTKATVLVVEGSAQANSTVQLYVDGTSSGSSCTANGSGAFSCTLGVVSEGTKSVTAKATGVNGQSVASQALSIVVDRTAPTVSWSTYNNIIFIGANDSVQVSITTSEVTTNLISSDVRLVCSITNACAIQNFAGSGRNYTFDFVTINNYANGGAVALLSGVFSDVAGNTNAQSSGPAIMFDTAGPIASLSRDNGLFVLTFTETPYGFSRNSLSLIQYVNNSSIGGSAAGFGIDNFGTYGTSGRAWRFTLSNYYQANDGMNYFTLQVGSVADVDGNNSMQLELSLPQ